jgi:hypothetical protein
MRYRKEIGAVELKPSQWHIRHVVYCLHCCEVRKKFFENGPAIVVVEVEGR